MSTVFGYFADILLSDISNKFYCIEHDESMLWSVITVMLTSQIFLHVLTVCV